MGQIAELLLESLCFLARDGLSEREHRISCDAGSGVPMFNIGKDIHSLTDFKRCTSDFVAQLHDTKRAIVLTVNGRPAVVVQDAEAYQLILDRLQELEATSGSENRGMAGGRS